MASGKYHACAEAPAGSFAAAFPRLGLEALAGRSVDASAASVEAVLKQGRGRSLEAFAALLSPAASDQLERLAGLSQGLTRRHFGKAVRLFAPLYLSNECVNICKYCGFSRNNDIPRVTLPVHQVVDETEKLARQGFRNVLLVAGEHPKWVSNGYVERCVRECLLLVPEIALELGPLEIADYVPLVRAGAEALIVYQETYYESTYSELHTAGPKKYYAWRMNTPERGYAAGFRRLGIGALFGLHDWRYEALAVAAHALHLQRHCWKAQVSISLPRMRPAAGGYESSAEFAMSDRDLVQVICALRLLLPHVGITLSTREPAPLRDGLMPLGVTLMSAGASTQPGGYSHFDETTWTPQAEQPGEQFHIADERPPAAVAAAIRARGCEPVWKDFDAALVSENQPEVAITA